MYKLIKVCKLIIMLKCINSVNLVNHNQTLREKAFKINKFV